MMKLLLRYRAWQARNRKEMGMPNHQEKVLELWTRESEAHLQILQVDVKHEMELRERKYRAERTVLIVYGITCILIVIIYAYAQLRRS